MGRDFMPVSTSGAIVEGLPLTPAEYGTYILLLTHWWRNGSVPTDDKSLGRITMQSRTKWLRIKVQLVQWGLLEDIDGVLSFPRWDRIIDTDKRLPLPAAVRDAVYKRDGEICRYCGNTEGPFQIDHIEPVRRGGSDRLENLTVACRTCNLAKGATPLDEWLQEVVRNA